MRKCLSKLYLVLLLTSLPGCVLFESPSIPEQAYILERDSRRALTDLYAQTPGAKQLAAGAKAILVFPEITKAGFVIGGQHGKGILFKGRENVAEYECTSASYGLQAGIQKFGYALFFMSDQDLDYLKKSDGWEIGVGPTITIVDQGFANSITTTTGRKGVYAFFFDQRGLMAGIGLQGTKITRIG